MSNKLIGFLFAVVTLFPMSAHALEVAPSTIKLILEPREQWNSQVLVYADANEVGQELYLRVVPLSSPQGDGAFLPDTDPTLVDSPAAVASSITLDEDSLVLREGRNEITYRIDLDPAIAPGDHFAGIMLSNRPFDNSETENDGISVATALVVPMRVEVQGERFEAVDEVKYSPESRFPRERKNQLNLSVSNIGNTLLELGGTWEVSTLLGKGVYQEDIDRIVIAPDGRQVIPFEWERAVGWFDIGIYRSRVRMHAIGSGTSLVNAWTWWIVLPRLQTFVFVGIPLLVIVSMLGVVYYRRRRKR